MTAPKSFHENIILVEQAKTTDEADKILIDWVGKKEPYKNRIKALEINIETFIRPI